MDNPKRREIKPSIPKNLKLWGNTVRGRLTLLNLVFLGLLFLILGLAQYFFLGGFLEDGLANSLRAEAKPVMDRQLGLPDSRENGLNRPGPRLAYDLISKETLAVVIEANGNILEPSLINPVVPGQNPKGGQGPFERSGSPGTNLTNEDASRSGLSNDPATILLHSQDALKILSTPPPDLLQRALKGEMNLQYDVNLPGWGSALVTLLPVYQNAGSPGLPNRAAPKNPRNTLTGVVVFAGSRSGIENTLSSLLLINILAFVILLALVGLASPLLATGSLRPLRRMIKTTRVIARGDLSQRVKLEPGGDEVGQLSLSFNQMVEQLEQLFKNQRQLVADASHELRTPLTAIKGSLEVLLLGGAESDPAVTNGLLKTMHGETARLAKLVNDLLTLSKLDQGEAIDLQPLNLLSLVQEVKASINLLVTQGEKEVILELSGFDPVEGNAPVVLASPDRLKQVLYNLLHNALKVSPPGGKINLDLSRLQEQAGPSYNSSNRLAGDYFPEGGLPGYYRLAIKDQGPGISPSDLPRIFDRFYRSDYARSRQKGGSGLGLSIARSLMQAQKGKIEVESAPGKGSTFYVYLLASEATRA